MKFKDNKQTEKIAKFRASELLGLAGFLSFSLILVLVPISSQIAENKSFRARQKAEVLAYQVVQLFRESNRQQHLKAKTKNDRSIASESNMIPLADFKSRGIIGLDPWGRPFHYQIQKTADSKIIVEVWSEGSQELNTDQLVGKFYDSITDEIETVRISLALPMDGAEN